MRFVSTRGQTPPVPFRTAVALGLAPDGGLFVPEVSPDLAPRLPAWANLSYPELAAEFLGVFATDVPEDILHDLTHRAYGTFTHPEILPLRRLDDDTAVLELFHGPTLAFKDFALQFLGRFYAWECAQSGRSLNVLGATSGDTGAAAIHGLLGQPRTGSFILYPHGRVSPLQERQMACTGAEQVHALAIDGTFDDAQRLVKAVFADRAFADRLHLGAVNSINLARILAQSVYHLWTWLRLTPAERERAEFVVPTGNFGNVLSGWMLTRLGVPIPRFRVATNRNDLLHRFFTTGEYRAGTVEPSLAPSMDIQVASNFERFLHFGLGGDSAAVRAALAELARTGVWRAPRTGDGRFVSSASSDVEITAAIGRVWRRHAYLVDPHTACGFREETSDRFRVVFGTAHPAKFPAALRAATGEEPTHPSLEALKTRPLARVRLPADATALRDYLAAHAVGV
jgi:threonine synthase